MNRDQRKAHARLWPVLLIVMLAVSVAALQARDPAGRTSRAAATVTKH